MKRWRDVGNGLVKCENTGEVAEIKKLRPRSASAHTIDLTADEWATLEQLAAKRTRESKTKHTPESVVRAYIAGARGVLDQEPWQHPSKG